MKRSLKIYGVLATMGSSMSVQALPGSRSDNLIGEHIADLDLAFVQDRLPISSKRR
jgi:hypothetical protein